MSPYDRFARAAPLAIEQAGRSPMAAGLAVWRPWRQFAAFLILAPALMFGAGAVAGIGMQIFPAIRPHLMESGPLPVGPLRLVDEGVRSVLLGGLLGALAFAILTAAAIAYRQPLRAFLWPSRRFDLGQFGIGMLGMTCVAVMALPFYHGLGSDWAPPIADSRYLDWTRPVYLVVTVVGLLIAAAAEEVVCRGVLLRLTALVIRHPLVLCLLNGLIFSALHLDPDPVAFIARTLSGMVWTWAALRLGGLEFAIGAHLANNLLISLVWSPLSEMEVGADSSWIMLAPEVFSAVVMVALIERLAGRSIPSPA